MTNENSSNNDKVSKNTLIIAIVAAVIATVALLEFTGKVKHNEAKGDYSISTYQAILIKKGEEHLISRKPSEQTAQCVDGYLFIQSDSDLTMLGLIVDYKNRGVRCQ
jgi:hypothetical protein